MSWNDPDREDTTIYKVVVNHEEQYSIWPEYKENPLGWKDVGKAGPKADCLAYIKEVWTELGVRLDRDACDFSRADFENGAGTTRIEGALTLDYVKVKRIADIDLATLEGKGRLVKAEGANSD